MTKTVLKRKIYASVLFLFVFILINKVYAQVSHPALLSDGPEMTLPKGPGILDHLTVFSPTQGVSTHLNRFNPGRFTSCAYIADSRNNLVNIVNTVSNLVIATVPLESQPKGVEISKDGKTIYVMTVTGISILNGITNTISSTIKAANTSAAVVSGDNKFLYVTDPVHNAILKINTVSNSTTDIISVGKTPYRICISPDGRTIYVANYNSNTVSVISTATSKVLKTIRVGNYPFGMSMTADGKILYVANLTDRSVSEINTDTEAVMATMPAGNSWIVGLKVSSDSKTLYVIGLADDFVSVYDIASGHLTKTISTGLSPQGLNLSADGKILFVVNSGSNSLSEISTVTNQVIATVTVGEGPVGFGDFISSTVFKPINIKSISPAPKSGVVSGAISVAKSTGGTAVSLSVNLPRSTISSFSPETAGRGSTVTISGTNFTGATAVRFGGVDAASFHIINATTIKAVVGAGTPGAITVVTPAMGTATSSAAFKYDGFTPYAYITNSRDNTVSVLNMVSNQVAAIVPVGFQPESVTLSPDGKTVYVMNIAGNNISVLDGVSNTVKTTIWVGNGPTAAVLSRDGKFLYVSNLFDNTVSIVSTAAGRVVQNIPVGNAPQSLCISADGTAIYVSNYLSNTISIISTASNHVINTIKAGNVPYAICVSPDGKFVYTANCGNRSVSIINTLTNTVTGSIYVGIKPAGIKISHDGKTLYVTNYGSNYVSIINIATQTSKDVPVGLLPQGLSLSVDGKTLYVVNAGSNSVSEISTATNVVTGTVKVGNAPVGSGDFIASQTTYINQVALAFEKIPALIVPPSLFLIYPNPGNGMVTLGFKASAVGIVSVLIYDMSGRKIGQQYITCKDVNVGMLSSLDLSRNPVGIYIIEALGNQGNLIGQARYIKSI